MRYLKVKEHVVKVNVIRLGKFTTQTRLVKGNYFELIYSSWAKSVQILKGYKLIGFLLSFRFRTMNLNK